MLSKSDFSFTLELINRSLDLHSEADLQQYYQFISCHLDVEYLIIGHTTSELSNAQSYFFGLPEWEAFYKNKNFITVDPIIPLAFSSDIAINWSDAYQLGAVNSNEFIERAQDYNLSNGMSFGNLKHSITSSSNIASVGSGAKSLDEVQSFILQQALPHLTEVLGRQSIWQRPELTVKETEVIKWCTAGKSYWETSQIMAISERTVKFHMKNICQKLDVTNKSQAIARGMSLGLTHL